MKQFNRNLLLLSFVAFFCSEGYAQVRFTKSTTTTVVTEVNDNEETNLFKYGDQVTDANSNFVNLFKNFPKYIDNACKIELLYYKKAGTIKNMKQSKHYLKKNFPPYVPVWGVSGSKSGSSKGEKQSSLRFTIENDPYSKRPDLVKQACDDISRFCHVGDEVWEVVFRFQSKTYKYYMFVDNQSKNVITDYNQFGTDISMLHIRLRDQAKSSSKHCR